MCPHPAQHCQQLNKKQSQRLQGQGGVQPLPLGPPTHLTAPASPPPGTPSLPVAACKEKSRRGLGQDGPSQGPQGRGHSQGVRGGGTLEPSTKSCDGTGRPCTHLCSGSSGSQPPSSSGLSRTCTEGEGTGGEPWEWGSPWGRLPPPTLSRTKPGEGGRNLPSNTPPPCSASPCPVMGGTDRKGVHTVPMSTHAAPHWKSKRWVGKRRQGWMRMLTARDGLTLDLYL